MEGSPTPPPLYAAYPRLGDTQIYGTSEKLFRLYRGYHGMSYTFLFIVLGGIAGVIGFAMMSDRGSLVIGSVLALIGVAAIVAGFFFAGRSGGDIGFGNGWSPATGIILGLLAPLVGIVMIAILQYLSIGEMKRYNIRMGSFGGLKGKVVKAKINELRAFEGLQPLFAEA